MNRRGWHSDFVSESLLNGVMWIATLSNKCGSLAILNARKTPETPADGNEQNKSSTLKHS